MNLCRSQLILLISLTVCGRAIESRLVERNPNDLVDSQLSNSQYSDSSSVQDTTDDSPPNNSSSFRRYKTCGRKDNCSMKEHKHKQRPLHVKSPHKIWGSNMCFCDDKCFEYGDCCVSEVISKPEMIRVRKNPSLGCIPTEKNYGVVGVTSCDIDNEFSKRCAKTEESDIYSDLAVFSKSTGTVYGNVFCALCHYVIPSDIVFADDGIDCGREHIDLDTLDYNNGQWYMKENASDGNYHPFSNKPICTLTQEGFPNGNRLCFSRLVESCPSSRGDLKQACNIYSQPVVVTKNNSRITRYKNPHCALCHGEDVKSLACDNSILGRTTSLRSLLDFDWDFKTCHWPHSLWDGVTQTCLPLHCQSDTCTIAQSNDNLQASKEKILSHEDIEIYLTFVVIIISTVLLLLHNLFYYLQPKRQNVPSRILKNLSWSIICGHISFLLLDVKFSVPFSICKFIGLSTQYFYSASFFWMNVMSYDVWRTFSKVSLRGSSSTIVKKYSLYAWGCPSLIVSLTMLADQTQILPDNFRPHIGLYKLCWFSDKLVIAVYFFFPIFTILLINLYFFGKTVLWFQKQTCKEFQRVNNEATGRKEYRKLWLYIKLSVIMGLTWLFCVVSALTKIQFFRYIFIISNGLQGAMIFIMFDLKRTTFYHIVDSFKSRTSWTSSSSDSKQLQAGETASTNISRNLNSTSLKFNSNKK